MSPPSLIRASLALALDKSFLGDQEDLITFEPLVKEEEIEEIE